MFAKYKCNVTNCSIVGLENISVKDFSKIHFFVEP